MTVEDLRTSPMRGHTLDADESPLSGVLPLQVLAVPMVVLITGRSYTKGVAA